MQEFRTALLAEGVGLYDNMNPFYTVFNKENKKFSVIWTGLQKDYPAFLRAYEEDVQLYSSAVSFTPKHGKPNNTFNVSMLPWLKFTSFNINVFGGGKYLLPIFIIGKKFAKSGKTMLPLTNSSSPCGM